MRNIVIGCIIVSALAACSSGFNAQGGMNMGGGLAKSLIDNQCRSELNQRSEWRMVALAMTAQKQREWEDKICGCASEEAAQHLTVTDMTHMLDAEQRSQVVARVAAKTVTACVSRLMK